MEPTQDITVTEAKLTELISAVSNLKQDSEERHRQLELVVQKLDKFVDKVQELNLITTQVLTKHETQLETFDARMIDLTKDVDNQSVRIDVAQKFFIEAMEKVADRMAASNREFLGTIHSKMDVIQKELKSVDDRLTALESWKNWLLGAAAVVGAMVMAVGIVAREWLLHLLFH
jgi:chromosome segregation ATPase